MKRTVYYDDEGNVYDEDVFGDDDYDNYEHWDEDEWTPNDGVINDGQSQYDWVGNPYSDEGHDDSNLYSEKKDKKEMNNLDGI